MPKRARLSAVRIFTQWLFRYPPYSPYVNTNVVVDFSAAAAYLARLNAASAEGEPRVTVQHLTTALMGRLLAEFPQANGRIVGRHIHQYEGVHVAAPVDLVGRDGAPKMELSVVVVEHADRLSLREIAERTTRAVKAERAGRQQQPLVRLLLPVAERTPAFLVHGLLEGLHHAAQLPGAHHVVDRILRISTMVTNPGAVFRHVHGGRFTGAAMNPPNRIISVGSVLGMSAIQDEVFAVDGRAEVRPALPLVFIFDHRLFDGVMASRILVRLVAMYQDPAALFGEDGRRRG
jgi:pyruvate/2-oxoglutarate dehydrogenase complex dihydrolipoamide acyltransferase (E2) component